MVVGAVMHRVPFGIYPDILNQDPDSPDAAPLIAWAGVLGGLAMIIFSCSILLLGVLPTDVMAIKVANRLLCFAVGIYFFQSALVNVVVAVDGFKGDKMKQ